MSHSPEPWSVEKLSAFPEDGRPEPEYQILDNNHCRVCTLKDEILARRIVACVNFLAGQSTEELTRERHCSETSLIKLLIMMTPEKPELGRIVTEQMVAACTEFLRGHGYVVKDPYDA